MNDRLLAIYPVLREAVSYDCQTGDLTYLIRPNHHFTNEWQCRAWNTKNSGRRAFTTVSAYGYFTGVFRRRNYLAHRVAWLLHYGSINSSHEIDHINGIRTDNRIGNLRAVTHQENCINTALGSQNTSGVVGVSWCKTRNLWRAFITFDGKMATLGRFEEIADAIAARKAAEKRLGFHENHGRCPGFKRRTDAGFATLHQLTGRVPLPAAPGHSE